MKVAAGFYPFLCFLPLWLVFGCSRMDLQKRLQAQMAMGTTLEIAVWQDCPSVTECFHEVERLENKFSRFREESEVARINDNCGLPVAVTPECFRLLEQAERFREITSGAFDVTLGKGRLILDREAGTVLLQGNPGEARISLGGIAKGYAVSQISRILLSDNIARAMINFGGNIFLIGYPPGKRIWSIGIKDPRQPDRLIAKVNVPEKTALATSGNYERPGHIIDPETGRVADKCLSVTVLAAEAMTADALSTGIFVLGPDRGMQLVEKLPGVEAVMVTKDGILVSRGLKDNFARLGKREDSD